MNHELTSLDSNEITGLNSARSQSITRAPRWWLSAAGPLFFLWLGLTGCPGLAETAATSNREAWLAEDSWRFEPERDAFSSEALLDLRSLNDNLAGDRGFLKRSSDGNDFMFSDGSRARFWALNDNAFGKDLRRHARFLAKRGINMVRFHCNITPTGHDLMNIDSEDRDRLWRGVAAMKQEGIYVTYSPYWAGPARLKSSMGVLDTGGAGNWGLLFFDRKLQEAYKHWLKLVLMETNSYTGVPLARDPALAIIEIQNEDSLLFWTVQAIKGPAKKELRRQFGSFLVKKYGSLEKALEAWQNAAPPPDQDASDEFGKGEAALYLVWQLTQHQGGPGQQRRCADQMQFLTQLMHDFNAMVRDYLKKDLGCQQLVNAGNWRTADNVTMLDAERWSYTANEVMAVNRYYTGLHEGKEDGWAIINGDRFTDESVLLRPRELPLNLRQVNGFPMLVTESSWVPPLSYQSEGPFLVGAYQSLSGIDAFYWFATGEEDWRQPGSANGFMPSEAKWVCATPMLMGQFPAAALMYRRGYVKQGAAVLHEHRSLDDLWQRRPPLIAEDPGYDPNRDKNNAANHGSTRLQVSPLAYLVGPVIVDFGGETGNDATADLSQFIQGDRSNVKSNTGQLDWDYARGLCSLNSPKAQGITGFLNRERHFKLADIEVDSDDHYATVLAVAMDDQPLSTSKKVLLQVGTRERPSGWSTRPVQIKGKEGEEVVSFGQAPWMIARSHLKMTINNPGLSKARVLDPNGMPVKEVRLVSHPGGVSLPFPQEALYVVLE